MSINVTVSGNPVRINRGRMVTTCDPTKTEFEKRRLMRLEQVRQQSKDIAENIRNKLKKQKSKCLSEVEKEGEIKLKKWQARKLLELKDQYQEALDEIGLGHKDAVRVEDEEDVLVEQQESNELLAKERGRAAAERLQIERNEESLRRAVPVQRKKMTRDVENVRSNLVASSRKINQGKSRCKKMKKGEVFDSDAENKVPQLVGLDEESDARSSSSGEEFPRKGGGGRKITKLQEDTVKVSKEQQTSATFQVPTSDKAAQTIMHEDRAPQPETDFLLDNRISERIKRRAKLNPEVDYCHFETTKTCICCHCPAAHPQRKDTEVETRAATEGRKNLEMEEETVPAKEISDKDVPFSKGTHLELPSRAEKENIPRKSLSGFEDEKSKTTDIPVRDDRLSKPTNRIGAPPQKAAATAKTGTKVKSVIPPKPKVTLRSTKDRPAVIGTGGAQQPVQYYDHPNRHSKSYLPKSSHVEEIDDEELVISPNLLSEDEIRERMRQRDIEAHLRGQLALEKEKMQREYKELLRKLPALQKQERICEIGMDKERYHMSRERLEDLERRRQNRLDNAYEELFVRNKPGTVTLPKRKDEDDEAQSLNLANWDVDFHPQKETSQSRSEQLNSLLSNLKSQKDSLLKEIESTLSKETLGQQTTKSNVDEVKSKSTVYTRVKTQRKRSRDERPISPSSSKAEEESTTMKTKSPKKGTTISTTTSISPSPRKKAKRSSSRKVLILQNTSTQTTPKTEQQSAATSPIVNTPVTESEPCTCKKDSLDDLCEIVIKIKDDEKPEIQVKPPFLGRSVRVVSEEVDQSTGKSGKSEKKSEKREKAKSGKAEREKSEKSEEKSEKREKEKSGKAEREKSGSWKDQLSQNVSQSTSTTSYLELPKKKVRKQKSPTFKDISKSMMSSTSSSGSGKQLDPRLLTYIRKLLSMSRASIDDLTVSAGSDVSTPSHSVVETPANNPLLQLMNVMKYFNIDAVDLQKQLSYVSDESSKHYNTSESVTVSSSTSDKVFRSCTEIGDDRVGKTTGEESKRLLQYADIAASCTKKISNLTAMIEKVRAEKKKMLESSSDSDKDLTTTSYRDLPDKKQNGDKNLDKLLTIDYSYAERLKKLSKEEIQAEKEHLEGETDDELLTRMKRLLESHKDVEKEQKKGDKTVATATETKLVQKTDGQPVSVTLEKKSLEESRGGRTAGLVTEKTTIRVKPAPTHRDTSPFPLFLDIPKLPRLEPPSLEKQKKRPPPTRSLRAVSLNAPHELSTIIEADSQLSTKLDSPMKVDDSQLSTKVESPKSGSVESSKSAETPDILTEVQKAQPAAATSSDDVSEMDAMETMLKSIGMEWAIPTLKKTRETLAMTSSSSGSKESEVSLREFLSKIASISSKSEDGSQLSETQGLSMIQLDNRKTSTPIFENEEKKNQPIFLTDSDLSSVREHSAKDSEERFYDLNEGSVSKTR